MLTSEEGIFLVEYVFCNNNKQTEERKQQFRSRFYDNILLLRNTVRDWVNKFREAGSVRYVGPGLLRFAELLLFLVHELL